jgi:hypothetical protein
MARRRSEPPEPEYGSCEGAYYLDHASTHVRAGVEETAAALVEITRAQVWERSVEGREVEMQPRAFLVYRLAGYDWSIIIPKNDDFSWDQAGEAVALSRRLRTRVVTFFNGDTGGCCGYDLYEGGDRLEHWYLPDGDEEEFESRIRPEGYWSVADGPYEYMDGFFRDQKAYEPHLTERPPPASP